jgi:small-conductance mechanosensitive channel
MLKSAIILLLIVSFSVLAFFITYYYYFPYSIRLFLTLIVLAVTYAVKYFVDNWLSKRVSSKREQFSFRRIANLLYIIVLSVAILAIWIQDLSILFVSTGIVGAGVAVALQDVFKNIAGGLLVLVNRAYKIGDRIEVNGTFGDVLDIGLFSTTLLEIKEWIDGDQATGRITVIPNSFVLSKQFNNYDKDYDFIWDEILIPLTYDSNWKAANDKIMAIIDEETRLVSEKADEALTALGKRYYVPKRYATSAVYITFTDNWVAFKVRYVTEVHSRRTLNSKLSQRILEEIERSTDIHIASTTLSVSGQINLSNKQSRNEKLETKV